MQGKWILSSALDYLSGVLMKWALWSAGFHLFVDIFNPRSTKASITARLSFGFFATSYAFSYLGDVAKTYEVDPKPPEDHREGRPINY